MKHILSYFAATACSVIIIGTALAFTEPTGTPPTNNVPAPLNVGTGIQEKAGGLVVQSIKAASITLGESTRTSWLDAASACAWEGTKCSCVSDSTTNSYWTGKTTRMITKMTCSGGRITNYGIQDLRIGDTQNDYYARCYNGQGFDGCTPSLLTSTDNH